MIGDGRSIDLRQARKQLGVKPGADAAALSAAFREAARRTHPDREGGDAERFRDVLDAYRLLREPSVQSIVFMPAPVAPRQRVVEITAHVALAGGEAVVDRADGRRLRLHLKPGLRQGQAVRAGDELFRVAIRAGDAIVRGDDIWITAAIDPALLADGGRITVETLAGPRTLWINRRAAERRLVRLPGEGLPAANGHRQGDLFVRLAPGPSRVESAAQTLLRRFAAAWAA